MGIELKFDGRQDYQNDAIKSVVDLFDGQKKNTSGLGSSFLESSAIGNVLTLADSEVLHNLRNIQDSNGLELSETLDGFDFDVEMETGTGKTYVYLRTAFELAKKYGFLKYMILVPSIAIKEGVIKSLELMKPHFTSLYPGQPFDATVFSGKTPEVVRSFATTNTLQFMIVTIDSLKGTGDNRIMRRESNKLGGLRPIDYLEATNPILIMDEPQNMESKLSHTAISDLNPSFVLRYSATHKTTRNIVYRLDPVDAHDLGIVKQIVVAEAKEKGVTSSPYVKLLDVKSEPWRARLELVYKDPDGVLSRKPPRWVKINSRLADVTKNPAYGSMHLSTVSLDPASAEITGVGVLSVGDEIGGSQGTLFKAMIRETVKEHCRREAQLRADGVKVLTLFFVDKVASFLGGGSNNFDANGDFVKWFDEAYLQEHTKYGDMLPGSPQDVRKAYFAQMRKGKGTSAVETFIDTTGNSQKDDDAYELIMKDKEELLDMNNPVRFIFSHSALREGWDNPNVFQICTLRDVASETEKRQMVGRGLRLPVNQNGERIKDQSVAQLTVIANESYKDFARSLQNEYKKAGIKIGFVREGEFAKIVTSYTPSTVLGFRESSILREKLKDLGVLTNDYKVVEKSSKNVELPEQYSNMKEQIIEILNKCYMGDIVKASKERRVRECDTKFYETDTFKDFWEKVSAVTTYKVSLNTENFIKETSEIIQDCDPIEPLNVEIVKASIDVKRGGAKGKEIGKKTVDIEEEYAIPNPVTELQSTTTITRDTIIDVLINSGRLGDLAANPNEYMQMVRRSLKTVADVALAEKISYSKTGKSSYSIGELIADGARKRDCFVDNLYEVKNLKKTDYKFVVCDTQKEREYAEMLDADHDVVAYIKMPNKFTVDTPAGAYTPTWGVIRRYGDNVVYEVVETGSVNHVGVGKVNAAKEHFATIGVNYILS